MYQFFIAKNLIIRDDQHHYLKTHSFQKPALKMVRNRFSVSKILDNLKISFTKKYQKD